MKFGNIHFLWMLWLIPVVIGFYIWAFKRKKQLLDRFVSKELKARLLAGFSVSRQRAKAMLIVAALLFAMIALIRPKYGFHWEEVRRRGVDIMIALDVSKSMLAEDVSPNRLERAKREIIDLLNLIEGDRVGLVAFAGTSFLQCPLTLDYGAVRIFLDELDTELIPVPGTALGEAITEATDAFEENDKSSRVLILITDGEDHLGQPLAAAKKANEQNVKVYAIGIGQEGGAPIPDLVNGGFKKDRKGEVVMTKLDEASLQQIALTTGGSYVRSVTGNLDLERIYKDIRASVEEKDLQSGRRKRFEERFQWPLFIAILLLLLEGVLHENRRIRPSRSFWSRVKLSKLGRKSKIAVLLLISLLYGNEDLARAQSWFKSKASQGEAAYATENYQEALVNLLDAQIEDPGNKTLKYNLANTYYKMGEYEKAMGLYQDVSVNGEKSLSQKSLYNLGNTVYRQGKLQEAVAFYQKALEVDPQDEDARHNLEFVREEIKRRLEEQKKRQQQQQQQQDGKKKQKQEQKQDQQPQQNQQNQEQQQQPQPEEDKQDQQQAGGQQEQEPNSDEDNQAGAAKEEGKSGEMSEEEAERWLSTLKSDRKDYLKKKFQGQRRYRVEKDW